MPDILSIPEKNLERQHKTLIRRINAITFTSDRADKAYDSMVRLIQHECNRFPNVAMAWPTILRRRGNSLEVQIKIVDALAVPNGSRYKQSMQYYGRPPATVAHKRVIEGSIYEIADLTLAIIRAAKGIAETLTALEQTKCSKEDINS